MPYTVEQTRAYVGALREIRYCEAALADASMSWSEADFQQCLADLARCYAIRERLGIGRTAADYVPLQILEARGPI